MRSLSVWLFINCYTGPNFYVLTYLFLSLSHPFFDSLFYIPYNLVPNKPAFISLIFTHLGIPSYYPYSVIKENS